MDFGRVPRAQLPTPWGRFTVHGFRDPGTGEEAVALVAGVPDPETPVLVRIHSQCLAGDVFHSARCDCREQLDAALRLISAAGVGVVVYEQQEGRGIGLTNVVRAYELQDQGLDTVEANARLGFAADARSYRMAAAILAHLGARRIRLLTNNPDKVRALEQSGIELVERVPLQIPPGSANEDHLSVKRKKLGHLLK
jgi:GTP cyclohydrolase II